MTRGLRNRPLAPRVLVVDDDDDLRECIVLLLEEKGFVVDEASDAGGAVRFARRASPAVALVDLGLPRIDGWEVIRVLRNAPHEVRRHIIAMSGFADPWSRERAFDAGCDQYIVKEGGAGPLVSAVQTYCTRAFS